MQTCGELHCPRPEVYSEQPHMHLYLAVFKVHINHITPRTTVLSTMYVVVGHDYSVITVLLQCYYSVATVILWCGVSFYSTTL